MEQDLIGPIDGPAEEMPPEAEPPAMVHVRLSGKDLEVTPETAEALRLREEEFQRRLSEQGAELGRLRQTAQPPKPVKKVDYDTLLFESPQQAIDSLREEIKQEVFQVIGSAYQNDQNIRAFWGAFYQENPELSDAHDLVELMLNANLQSWAELPVSVARQRLADAVREKVHKLAKVYGTKVDSEGKAKAIDSSASRQRREAPPVEGPVTIASILRKRKAARQGKK